MNAIPKQPQFLDGAHRRLRTVSQPKGIGIQLNRKRRALLEAVRFGPVPSTLLFPAYAGAEGGYYPHFQRKVMRDLFHERLEGETLLSRPPELNPIYAMQEPAWVDLTPAGWRAIDRRFSVPREDPLHHRGMGACIDLSFHYLAAEHGLRFIEQEKVISDDRFPEATRKSENPININTASGTLEPDRLIGFYKLRSAFRFYLREDDRGSHSMRRTIFPKLDKCLEVINHESYRKQWNLPNLYVMFVTTQPGRITTCLDYLKGKPGAENILFKSLPTFDPAHWRAPRKPLTELFEPWITIDGKFDITA